MRIGMISDFVPLTIDAPQQRDVRVGILTDDEERRFHAPRRECVEDRSGPIGIRSVVEGERDPVRMDVLRAEALDDVRRRIAPEALRDHLAARRIDCHGARSSDRLRSNTKDLSFAVELGIVPRQDSREAFGREEVAVFVEHAPQGRILRAEAPERHPGHA